MARKPQKNSNTIARNKRASFEYHLEERLEAGLELRGWEVKALREGRIQFADAYVLLKDGEAYLFGARIDPLPTTSTHEPVDPTRTRKLLLHRREIDRLIGAVERSGYACIPVSLYWKGGRAKAEVALAKGKKLHDKRRDERDRDWSRDRQRLLKEHG